ncbi:TniQ family protein [Neorhizobium galegae]|uniref:TniQ family protein n=1 Tax=Neorhizobium galegae TaxID=399 RepID=UPI001278928A|nr:TniQ family protein [Neorhizobium galegae]KAA9387731.1 hypothetical protein F4V88_15300 [Neorhizobium galegae]MCM2501962.1 TniQ family protein [Neorhizobium galegae]MCQ1772917.1 TniQ family protein [Neorhizobium galegae]MCQ1799421.1 TniQ family protein [Neorhizobium galegae]
MTIAFDIRTTPFSRWTIENERDEPGHGYYARLVAAEGHSSVTRYSDGIDVDTRSMNPEKLMEIVLKLPLSEERKLRLRNATPVRKEDGYWLAGQRFNPFNLSFSSRRWCPGCLHESPHHRAWWDIIAIMDCPYHRHPLVDLDHYGEPVRWWWPVMNMSPRGQMLAAPFPRANDTETFAGYIIGRLGFDRCFEAPLLDQSDIGTVIDLCVMVGRLLSSTSVADIPPADWKYGRIGFEALGRNAAHFVEAVRAWVRVAVAQEDRVKGYGFVFEWIIERWWNLLDKRLTDMLQKVFRKALALEGRGATEPLTSDAFLDDEVSLRALALRMGVSRNGIATVADMLGMYPARERYRGLVMFDAAEADAIEHHWHQMANRDQAGAMLGLTYQEILPLIEAKLLPEYSSVTYQGEGGYRYLKSDVHRLLERLRSLCQPSGTGPTKGFSLYAKINGIHRGELAVAILRGEQMVSMGSTSMAGFEGMEIVCEPSKSTRRPLRVLRRPADSMAFTEALIELNLTRPTVMKLIELDYLTERQGDGAARWFDKSSVVKFANDYRSALDFLSFLDITIERMVRVLADHGHRPIVARTPKRAAMPINLIFRYSDIVRTFKLHRDPSKVDEPIFLELWSKVHAVCDDLPPYVQLPSRLPVVGQVVSNAGNNIAFFVHFDTVQRSLVFEGRREAAELGKIYLFPEDQERSVARLEEALVSLIDETPRRR